jgi:hypothetical protein
MGSSSGGLVLWSGRLLGYRVMEALTYLLGLTLASDRNDMG